MNKERFEQTATDLTSQDIIDSRPKDRSSLETYWNRYEKLAEQAFFTGKIDVAEFENGGFYIHLRQEMELDNIRHAVGLGRPMGRGETGAEIDAIAALLENVVEFVPIKKK